MTSTATPPHTLLQLHSSIDEEYALSYTYIPIPPPHFHTLLQNVSMVNAVLATITASVFKQFADAIELEGVAPAEVARRALRSNWKVQ